jgi:N-methylhydantoinase A
MLDIDTIGAGGGSIAWVDPGGRFRVGPRSAGSEPGPACYGRGGTEATVTDSNVVLGFLDPEERLSGAVRLDTGKAAEACARLGTQLGLDVVSVAAGIHRIVNTAMVGAIRTMLSGRGLDPRDFGLVAFGGAGPLHAAELAVEMGIPRVLVPPVPGCHSAMGILMTDARHHLVQSHVAALKHLDVPAVEALLNSLQDKGKVLLLEDGVPSGQHVFVRSADCRYVGQDFPLEVAIDAEGVNVQSLEDGFHRAHQTTYGFHHAREAVELVNVRLRAVGALPKLPVQFPDRKTPSHSRPQRRVYFVRHGWVENCAVLQRSALQIGSTTLGPLLVEQSDTTTVVPPDFRAHVDGQGILILERTNQNV